MQVIDLFCGAGGLSIGLESVGFNIVAGVDKDTDAIRTFQQVHPKAVALDQDVLDSIDVLRKSYSGKKHRKILVGGPPCQGFCSINPNRSINDPRNSCVDSFLFIAADLLPDFIFLENVTGLLSLGGGFARKKLNEVLTSLGYHVNWKVLQAAHYGAPQSRWRLIVAASKFGPFEFPKPKFHAVVRANVAGGKDLTFTTSGDSDLFGNLPPATTVWDAISDLPKLENGGGIPKMAYGNGPTNNFQRMVRGSSSELFNHQSHRLAPVNMERILKIPEGGNWQSLPYDLQPQNIKRSAEKWGRYTPTRFGRLRRDGLFTTILTKPEPYWGSFIHPVDDRLISVREAARAQTFPDYVQFQGSLVSQYRQVGNAVPSVIGRALGEALLEHFITYKVS